MELTPAQQQAIAAPGQVLVKASAGTGKTHTLVQRCLARVLATGERIPVDRVLVVTFTEAAATEVRRRLREALEHAAAERPEDAWLSEQLALLDAAPVGTLHSFCLHLVRQHFYALSLDPQLTVLESAQAELLAATTLEMLLERHYAGDTPGDIAVQELIMAYGRGRDSAVREWVRQVHHYTQTLADPLEWFERELRACHQPRPRRWETWLREGFDTWRRSGLELLRAQPPENEAARTCLEALTRLGDGWTRDQAGEALARIRAVDHAWPRGKKGVWRPSLAKFLDAAAFWHSLATTADGRDPLQDDWTWVRPHLAALLELAREFAAEYAQAKRDQGTLDFHDLEQFTLRLLWDSKAHRATAIAEEWRRRLRLVFVDEYQDINAAQDRILELLSRDGLEANRFLVGDMKQSIYRFRLANPRIFRHYEQQWRDAGPGACVVPLVDNFRSHGTILDFVNRVFAALMRPEVGGVDYDREAHLIPGRAGAESPAPDARVELHLRLKGCDAHPDDDEVGGGDSGGVDPLAILDEEHEARLVAQRLRGLHSERWRIWDRAKGSERPVEWRDMVVLLRSPRNKAESYAKEFARWGVPLVAARRGFYEGTEITDLLSVLRLLDNPLQDVPLLAVLRSPIAGLTVDDLASVRLSVRRGCFWTALQRFHATAREAPAWPQIDLLFQRFHRWRQQVRRGALSRCLEAVLDETGYLDWLATQPRGEMRCANVGRLLAMTRQFDRLQRQGLFRFLRMVEAQQAAELETEPVACGTENAVRLMSIHQSKGLEFPLVVVADLGKAFNLEDLKQEIILDEVYGLSPQVQPPHAGPRYPSLPYWLARQRQRDEAIGEELRLLYVALTRACDKLILTGTASRKTAEEKWPAAAAERLAPAEILAARTCLGWLGPLLPSLTGRPDWLTAARGESALLSWTILGADDLSVTPPAPQAAEDSPEATRAGALLALGTRLGWRYPHTAATLESAKTSVSGLRRRLAQEPDAEAQPLFPSPVLRPGRTTSTRSHPAAVKLSAAEVGIAHHVFLQFVALDLADGRAGLRREATRMAREGILQDAEEQALDFAALEAFWDSALGKKFRAQPAQVHRELPFTSRFNPAELTELRLSAGQAGLADEFVVVQGVADWAVILPDELWLVDFKTGRMDAGDVPAKVKLYEPQLRLYATALSRIYRRPVTRLWLHFLALDRSVSLPASI